MFGDLAKKKLILTHRKDLCIGDYLIDDRLKNGAGEFTGELLHFGPGNDFPHWEKVIDYLRPLALEEMEQMELGGPVSKEEENESRITKTQINDVIQGKSKVSHGTAIQAIASYLRGSQGANSKDSRPKDYKIQEENRLRKYASDKRLYMDVDTEQKPIDKGEKAKKNEEKPKEMSNVKELIEKVRIAAEKELEHCNGVDTPAVCQLINDAKGKNMVLDQICEYVGKNGMTIGEAINYIERTNNPELSNY